MKISTATLLYVIGAFISLPPIATAATTYYVSVTGNDAGSGSETQPWRTIQRAANMMAAGDTVIVAPGDYPEKVATKTNGTSPKPVTFRATSTNARVRGFAVNHAYQVISGFSLTGIGEPMYGSSVTVSAGGNYLTVLDNVFDGSPVGVSQLFIAGVPITNLVARGNSFLNGNGTAVTLFGSNHTISHNFFTSPNGNDAIRLLSSNTTISDNEFRNWSLINSTSNHPDLIQGYVYEDNDYVVNNIIERNLFVDCAVTQIGMVEDHALLGHIGFWTWRNNVFVNVGSVFQTYGHDMYFYNNLFYRCGQNSGHPLSFREPGGARFPFTTANVSLTASTITTSQSVDFTTGTAIKFFNNPPAPLAKSTVYYARVTTPVTITVHATAADAINNINPIQFSNVGSDVMPMGVSRLYAKGSGDNGKVYNNIFVECGSAPSNSSQGWYMTGPGTTGFQADRNLVIGTGTGTAKVGFTEPNGINGRDPQFDDAASRNFHLQMSSPCVGQAAVIDGYGADFYDTPRGRAWDIGPIEYAGSPLNSRISQGIAAQ